MQAMNMFTEGCESTGLGDRTSDTTTGESV